MDFAARKLERIGKRLEWRFRDSGVLVILYILLLVIHTNCQTILKDESQEITKTDVNNIEYKLDSKQCHSCHDRSKKSESDDVKETSDSNSEGEGEVSQLQSFIEDIVTSFGVVTEKLILVNKTETQLESEVENFIDSALSKDRYEIFDGIEIKPINDKNEIKRRNDETEEGRALFSKFSYEYRLFQKVRNFVETHILSINLPKAARLMGFRSFGLKKFFLPLLIGAQVFKSILLAMFLPSILGSFGKILGKGISQLSAASSQASYPPANTDDQTGYNNENKDFMGYETEQAGVYAYPQEGYPDPNEVNDLSNVDMSRFGASGQKVAYLPSKNSYYKNQMTTANSYKVFQKIPASSMILSNYDPFYSPLLSRLDGIFARLGLTPSEPSNDGPNIGGQSLSDVKLEACREQLICLMYSSPAKYAPYSNLVSAQLSRELNELRRPVSDNPEILRFFRYMRAARRGQEGVDCMRAHPGCSANTAPAHTMIAAYHDINKLVTARKIKN